MDRGSTRERAGLDQVQPQRRAQRGEQAGPVSDHYRMDHQPVLVDQPRGLTRDEGGARCFVVIDSTSVPQLRMVSRPGRTVTSCFPELGPLVALIVAGEGGRPDFYALSRQLSASKATTIRRLGDAAS